MITWLKKLLSSNTKVEPETKEDNPNITTPVVIKAKPKKSKSNKKAVKKKAQREKKNG